MSLLENRLPIFKYITGDNELNPNAKSFSPKNRKRLRIFRGLTSKLNHKAKSFSPKNAKGKRKRPTKKRRRPTKRRR